MKKNLKQRKQSFILGGLQPLGFPIHEISSQHTTQIEELTNSLTDHPTFVVIHSLEPDTLLPTIHQLKKLKTNHDQILAVVFTTEPVLEEDSLQIETVTLPPIYKPQVVVEEAEEQVKESEEQ